MGWFCAGESVGESLRHGSELQATTLSHLRFDYVILLVCIYWSSLVKSTC